MAYLMKKIWIRGIGLLLACFLATEQPLWALRQPTQIGKRETTGSLSEDTRENTDMIEVGLATLGIALITDIVTNFVNHPQLFQLLDFYTSNTLFIGGLLVAVGLVYYLIMQYDRFNNEIQALRIPRIRKRRYHRMPPQQVNHHPSVAMISAISAAL